MYKLNGRSWLGLGESGGFETVDRGLLLRAVSAPEVGALLAFAAMVDLGLAWLCFVVCFVRVD